MTIGETAMSSDRFNWGAQFWHGLTFRIAAVYALLGAITLLGVGSYLYERGRAALEQATLDGLSAVTAEKAAALESWFNGKITDINIIATASVVSKSTEALVAADSTGQDYEQAHRGLARFFERWSGDNRRFVSLFIMNVEQGRIVAATDSNDVGKFKEDRPYFMTGKNGTGVTEPYYSLSIGAPTVVFSAPIKSEHGDLLGVVAGRANLHEMQGIIERRSYDAETSDTFIVNAAGLYITQPHFIDDAATFRFGFLSPGVARCLAGESGTEVSEDYRGVVTAGSYRWIAERRFCLTSKIDRAEAFEPIRQLGNSVIAAGATAILVAILAAISIARSITRPIKRLQEGTAQIAQGKLDVHLPEASRSELGLLASEFNKMARTVVEKNAQLLQRAGELQGLNSLLQQANAELQRENAQRREAEGATRDLNEQLERIVAARTAELKATNEELEAFAYSVSHDLRAPLRAMDGYSQALIEDYAGKLDRDGMDFLARITSNSRQMGQLIDDLLLLSRVTRGVVTREPVDLSAMGQAIVGKLRARTPDRSIDVKIAPDMVAEGDRRLIRIALHNLMENAWKFTGKSTHAKVELGSTVEDGRTVYFVRDNGVGFDMKYADKLFKPFQRLHGQNEIPGTGIGLAIVARVMRRHGGAVWARGAVGEGATVFFQFPA